jgi:hypothetical protein
LAARRFASLAERLSSVSAKELVIQMASDASADELRHADQCDALAAHLGGLSPAPRGAAIHAREVAPSGLLPRERVLYEVVAMSCITETLGAALLGEIHDQAEDDLVRRLD